MRRASSSCSLLIKELTSGPVISIKLMSWVKASFCAAVSFTLVKMENCSCVKLPTSSQLSFSPIIFEQRQSLRAWYPQNEVHGWPEIKKYLILWRIVNLIIMCLPEYLQAAVIQSFFFAWPCLGMEHQHMWICAHVKWSQTGNCLSTVQRSSGGQWLLWQHNPVHQ